MPAYDVFLSHAPSDSVIADGLTQLLERRGLEVASVPRNLAGGASFDLGIQRLLQDSNAVIVLLSQESVASRGTWREVETAYERHMRIVPCFVDVAFELPGPFRNLLGRYQYLELRGLRDADAVGFNATVLEQVVRAVAPRAPLASARVMRATTVWLLYAEIGAVLATIVAIWLWRPFFVRRPIVVRNPVADLPLSFGDHFWNSLLTAGTVLCVVAALLTLTRTVVEGIAAVRIFNRLKH